MEDGAPLTGLERSASGHRSLPQGAPFPGFTFLLPGAQPAQTRDPGRPAPIQTLQHFTCQTLKRYAVMLPTLYQSDAVTL
jgi:hypothetical protein